MKLENLNIIFFWLFLFPFFSQCSANEINELNPDSENNGIVDHVIVFNQSPKNNQLFARNANNQATVVFSGNVAKLTADSSIKIEMFDSISNFIESKEQKLSSEYFNMDFVINSGLTAYTFKIYIVSDGISTLSNIIENVVCGDVFIVHGQSNAWAIDYDNFYSEQPKRTKWVRTFGSMHAYNQPKNNTYATDSIWYVAIGTAPTMKNQDSYGKGMVGVLGMSLGLKLVDSLQIPILVINGAGGGGAIDQYLKKDDLDLNTTYGRLQYRLEKANVVQSIRGFIWNQGESDGGSSVEKYENQLSKLFSQLKKDFSFEKFYLIQTPPGCPSLGSHVGVREAQRQFFNKNSQEVNLVTRHGFSLTAGSDENYYLPDNCHYHASGYTQLASLLGSLVLSDIYNKDLNFISPKIEKVVLSSPEVIELVFDRDIIFDDSLTLLGETHYIKDYFSLEDSSIKILEISFNPEAKNTVVLHLSKPITQKYSITYLSEEAYLGTSQAYLGPWILDAYSGSGAVGFTKIIE